MAGLDNLDLLFIGWAFFLQLALLLHFALRKWRFGVAIRYGPLVYALGIPSAVVSLLLLVGGKSISFLLAGFVCLIWAIYGYSADYLLRVQWRDPVRWPILIPYLILYLTTIMFYWWPLALFSRGLWFAYALLFVLSSWLNISSHSGPDSEHPRGSSPANS